MSVTFAFPELFTTVRAAGRNQKITSGKSYASNLLFTHGSLQGQDSVQISVWLEMSAAWSEAEVHRRNSDISRNDGAEYQRNITAALKIRESSRAMEMISSRILCPVVVYLSALPEEGGIYLLR